MNIFLAVPYPEKDEAKALGAKWDAPSKRWYIPPKEVKNRGILLERWSVNEESLILIGEDRTFGGNELFVDMIPKTSWFSNVRSLIHPSDWDRVRNHIYNRVNHICECCNNNTKETHTRLDAHERWSFDNETKIQKLVRLVALCEFCHQTTHFGLAGIQGKTEEAKTHLNNVRLFTEDECGQHLTNASKLFKERCKVKWEIDITIITSNGIKMATNVMSNSNRVNTLPSTTLPSTTLPSTTLPSNTFDYPWLVKNNYETAYDDDVGKWMLFYDKSIMDENWIIAKELYDENKLVGVISMKCSTNYINDRASSNDNGIIIFYCNDSINEETIKSIGRNILTQMQYIEQKKIFYKTDLQTSSGTNATGNKINSCYSLTI